MITKTERVAENLKVKGSVSCIVSLYDKRSKFVKVPKVLSVVNKIALRAKVNIPLKLMKLKRRMHTQTPVTDLKFVACGHTRLVDVYQILNSFSIKRDSRFS